MFDRALKGSRLYYAWLGFLGIFILVGVICYLYQYFEGLGVTGMGNSNSWGLYLMNFTFLVGVAASAVMLIIPYYLHRYHPFHRLTIFGEFLAIAAIIMCILFVTADLGRPDRFINLFLHPSPNSILMWDIVVLMGYLGINAIVGYLSLDAKRKGEEPKAWLKVITYISIPWAVSIHTVTAFIYSGMAAKPFWLTAIMAPRFLASAFCAGPALLIIALLILRRFTTFDPGKEAIQKLAQITLYATIITVFFFIAETFTVLYSGVPEHTEHYLYLVSALKGWMWPAFICWIVAIFMLIVPQIRNNNKTLVIAAILVFASMWIDKGIGLMLPGFSPNAFGEEVAYSPTIVEWFISFGIWAIGFTIMTVLWKIGVSVMHEIGEDKPEEHSKEHINGTSGVEIPALVPVVEEK